MVSCGRRRKCTPAVAGNPKISLAALTYPKVWTGSLSHFLSPYFLLFYQEKMFKVAKLRDTCFGSKITVWPWEEEMFCDLRQKPLLECSKANKNTLF